MWTTSHIHIEPYGCKNTALLLVMTVLLGGKYDEKMMQRIGFHYLFHIAFTNKASFRHWLLKMSRAAEGPAAYRVVYWQSPFRMAFRYVYNWTARAERYPHYFVKPEGTERCSIAFPPVPSMPAYSYLGGGYIVSADYSSLRGLCMWLHILGIEWKQMNMYNLCKEY